MRGGRSLGSLVWILTGVLLQAACSAAGGVDSSGGTPTQGEGGSSSEEGGAGGTEEGSAGSGEEAGLGGSDAAGTSGEAGNNSTAGSGGDPSSTGGTTGGSGESAGASGSAPACTDAPHCSADGAMLLDCDGQFLKKCPKGCVDGVCSGPCDNASTDRSSYGCDYYAVTPDVTFDGVGGCYAAFVVNTSQEDILVSVDYKGATYDPSTFGYIPNGSGAGIKYAPIKNGTIPAGQIAILFLNRFGFSPLGLNTDCPKGIVPAVHNEDAARHGTGIGNAFRITTTAPVVVYDIYPYGGGQSALTSATMLLPTTAWGNNYIAVSPHGNGAFIGGQPFVEVVAQQDNTSVTILPSAPITAGNGVPGSPKGVPQTYSINRGQVLQFTQGLALEGSVIQSNVPVGVWAGMTSMAIESCCDESAHQQIPPIAAMGSEYVGVRYRNRYDDQEEAPPWRMVGTANGTTLTWEPSPPAGAPTALALGQVVEFSAPGPFVVRSQDADHPFYMSAHMTGAAKYDPQQLDPNGSAPADGRGDAEFVNLVPPGEFLDRYVFFTDPTYPETDLVVIRKLGPNGFADVNLDCAGTLGGWQPVGTSGQYEYTRFDLVRHNFQPQGNCDNGRHEMTSPQPFGLTVWGWGSAETGQQFQGFYTQYVSYAYPAGASFKPINDVVVSPVIK